MVLVLLVPAALGLACLVEFLDQKRLAVAGWFVAVLCLAEQGLTTKAYDAAANRATIDRLADRIDRASIAFYYRPVYGRAVLSTPTGRDVGVARKRCADRKRILGLRTASWHTFFKIDFDPRIDVEDALAQWEQSHGLSPHHVQLIGTDRPGTEPLATRLDRP